MEALINTLLEVIINPLIYLLFAIAFLIFLWGILQLIAKADDDKARKDGQRHILYGIIGLSIMVGAWGIIRFLDAVVSDLDETGQPTTLEVYEDEAEFQF